ncbi:hypothetical protein [Bifidobacterium animalis]|uniref:hypothetical protein n=1 Tax=Bifidobacterium animalis TaxID=28025 RepID=UPI003F9323CB
MLSDLIGIMLTITIAATAIATIIAIRRILRDVEAETDARQHLMQMRADLLGIYTRLRAQDEHDKQERQLIDEKMRPGEVDDKRLVTLLTRAGRLEAARDARRETLDTLGHMLYATPDNIFGEPQHTRRNK